MPETWPATLPQCFTFESFALGFAEGRIRSENDAGPAKVRRRSSANVRLLAGQMVMTGAQLAEMETFINTTLDGGSLPFTFPSQTAGSPYLARFSNELPTVGRHAAGKYIVTMKLEILP